MVLIENGTVADGTGAPSFPADVAIDGDRIADVFLRSPGSPPVPGDFERLDASGCLVTPGFIDVHAHSDTYLLIEPDAPSKISQGITTEINGNCGGSCAPRFGEARLSGDWASMTYPLPGGGMSPVPGPVWRSFGEYRALLEETRPAVNTVQFVGHNTLRSSAMGYKPEKAGHDDLRRMSEMLEECLDCGAHGLTTGLVYQPGKWSAPEEVETLAAVAAARGGFYATHMRSEGDSILEAIDEVLDLVRKTGIRAEISHLKTSGRRNWGKIGAVLDKLEGAVASGLVLGSDRYPYCQAGTDLDVILPDWAGAGGRDPELARLRDPAQRARIEKELSAREDELAAITVGGGWSGMVREWCGRTLGEAARAMGATAARTACEFILADETRTGAFFPWMCRENLQKILSRPWVLAGSDASLRAPSGQLGADHPHPRAYGTMPRFFRMLTGRIEGCARICGREEAVRRMTSAAARRFGLRGRGEIAKGAFADVAVWREDSFADLASYDKPHVFSSGVEAVFVNGALSFRDGRCTGARAGRFLERA